MRQEATLQLDLLYDEIRPAIEEYERDSQDSAAEKWTEASCLLESCKQNSTFTPP